MYLDFVHIGFSESGKTTIHEVRNKEGVLLGHIKFKAAWRRYCFYAKEELVFDSECLKEIVYFIDLQMRLRIPYATKT